MRNSSELFRVFAAETGGLEEPDLGDMLEGIAAVRNAVIEDLTAEAPYVVWDDDVLVRTTLVDWLRSKKEKSQ